MTSSHESEETGQSVADVLSSIRQVLHNEHLAAQNASTSSIAPEDEDDDILVLSPAMMTEDPTVPSSGGVKSATDDETDTGQPVSSEAIKQKHDSHADGLDKNTQVVAHGGPSSISPSEHADGNEVLSVTDLRQIELIDKAQNMSGSLPIPLNDETISDTGSSFSVLQKTLQEKYLREHEERKVAITHEGSLTVEDIVRQEVRVFLKKWLDAHLAGIVQAAVRKEVERLTQRGL
ncbi:hypothetical protein ASN_3605 [Acetobacter senegalensis]|uniref:DUF2497 domain-containing protein n=1 Tax=Acetobacter senegalensis TaxID=446692 RepID=A0A0U4Y7F7_9PROT|nr:DUF2497 domain-containing protein [Acetobacter senegalensis]CEF42830.1 hypothetical protein ASN_3605 [Acetobacter senegalensis]